MNHRIHCLIGISVVAGVALLSGACTSASSESSHPTSTSNSSSPVVATPTSIPATDASTATERPTVTSPIASVPPVLMHFYHQENWSKDEVKDLLIKHDGQYRFTDVIGGNSYVELGTVNVDGDQIKFTASTPTSTWLTLDRGEAARWQLTTVPPSTPTLYLGFPEHDGYGGPQGADAYFIH